MQDFVEELNLNLVSFYVLFHSWFRQMWLGKTIPVYSVAEGKVVEVHLRNLKPMVEGKCGSSCDETCANLHANDIMYLRRGWCRAEYEWAKPNTVNISQSGFFMFRCCAWYNALFFRRSLPWTPQAFQRSIAAQQLKFTHRSDMEPVVQLQKAVFQEKVATLEQFRCNWLRLDEVEELLELIPLLKVMQEFQLDAAYVPQAQQLDLVEALCRRRKLLRVAITAVPLRAPAVEILMASRRQLQKLVLDACNLRDDGAEAVANVLAVHLKLQELSLGVNGIRNRGARALAKALQVNSVLKHLNLEWNRIESLGAIDLAKALNHNKSITLLEMTGNPVGPKGLRALRHLPVQSFDLECAADKSWAGWLCIVLLRNWWWMLIQMFWLPLRFFTWRQKRIHQHRLRRSNMEPCGPCKTAEKIMESPHSDVDSEASELQSECDSYVSFHA